MNSLRLYKKPYITPKDLVKDYLIIQKGLTIPNDDIDFAEKVLSQINWYHLKIYFYPFIEDLNAQIEKYKPGTTFQDGWNIYLLDEDLRKIVIEYTLKVELIAKSYLDQSITEFTKDPFWYLNDDYFLKNKQPYYERNQILNKMANSEAEFIKHFKETYKSPYNSNRLLPPFWIAMELISFDQFLKIIEKLNPQLFSKNGKNALDECAKQLNADNFKQLKSWLEVVKYVRNLACHNSRLWNAKHMLPKGLAVPTEQGKAILNPHRIYLTLLVIHRLTKDAIILNGNIKSKLKTLIEEYKSKIKKLESQMGFPQDWYNNDIWN